MNVQAKELIFRSIVLTKDDILEHPVEWHQKI